MAAPVYKPVVYSEVRRLILPGDQLLHRPSKHLHSRLIGMVGGGAVSYSHAGLAAWWGDCLLILETLQLAGARAVMLSSQVEQAPGHYDVYRIRPPFDSAAAVEAMLRITGTPYGYRSLLRAGLRHVPGLGWLVPPNDPRWPPMCSQAVCRADRAGGADPLPNQPEWKCEPWHLARPGFADYQFTLFHTADQIKVAA